MSDPIVIVTGGRNYHDAVRVTEVLLEVRPSFIAQGGATGADAFAKGFAKRMGVPHATFHALWDAHGKSAGPRRNLAMLGIMQPDLVVAFPGGKGTAHMVKIAREQGVEVREVER